MFWPLMKSICFFSWQLYCTNFKTFETLILHGKQNSLTGPVITVNLEKRALGQRGPKADSVPLNKVVHAHVLVLFYE